MDGTAEKPEDLSMPYRALRRSMLGFLRKRVGDSAVAEDLLQEVFLKALIAGGRGQKANNLSGWLYRIARNTVIDYYRAKRPSEKFPEGLLVEDPAEDPVERSLSQCLRPFTHELPPLYRDALLAADFDGRPLAALAKEWRVSLSAVKSRAGRGRKLLKEKLLECCRVDLSVTGKALDFQENAASPDCGNARGCADPGLDPSNGNHQAECSARHDS